MLSAESLKRNSESLMVLSQGFKVLETVFPRFTWMTRCLLQEIPLPVPWDLVKACFFFLIDTFTICSLYNLGLSAHAYLSSCSSFFSFSFFWKSALNQLRHWIAYRFVHQRCFLWSLAVWGFLIGYCAGKHVIEPIRRSHSWQKKRNLGPWMKIPTVLIVACLDFSH